MLDVRVDDQRHLDGVLETFKDELDTDYAPPHVKRQAHPKMHGCVQAILEVDAELKLELRHGVFEAPGKKYRAWVRFSNAFGMNHDLKFVNRGMAIKVLGVKGDERLLRFEEPFTSESHTQDFVLSTHDAFVLPNTKEHDYAEFSTAARRGFIPLAWLFVKRGLWRGFKALIRGATVLARNPLAIRYFSQTAYRLGPELKVKLQARPRRTAALDRSLPNAFWFSLKAVLANVILSLAGVRGVKWLLRLIGFSGTKEEAEVFCERYIAPRHLLRHAMSAFLGSHPAEFDMLVQTQVDPVTMPDDDPTVRWSERQSPFQRVATLTIPRQVFWPAPGMPPTILKYTSDMVDAGENMSFSPWHGLRDHEPLGDISNARGRLYLELSRHRHGENQLTTPDPSAEYDRLREVVQTGLMEPLPETHDR